MRKITALAGIFLLASTINAAAAAAAGDNVRVWVEFEHGKAAAAERLLASENARVHFRFDDLDAFVVTVSPKVARRLAHNSLILSVTTDEKRYPMGQKVPYGIDSIQARKVWDADHDGVIDAGAPTGAGRMVCLIDSGIDIDHPDLAGVDIVGGYPDDWSTDNCGHGSHVAGTIAAMNNDIGVVGVSPGETSLYIVKVFGNETEGECDWTYSSTLVNAAQQCVAAGADVINMSLGGSAGLIEGRYFNKLISDMNVLPIAAAGNDGTTSYSYPASYDGVMSVAAVDEDNVVADFSQKNSAVEIAAPGVSVLSTVPYKYVSSVTVDETSYDSLPLTGSAKSAATGNLVDGGLCTEAGDWSGMVVLCERGDITFYEKAEAVIEGGGIAALIYNNASGNFSGTLGDDVTVEIPVASLSQEDGEVLASGSIGDSTKVKVKTKSDTYDYYSGTSMATPHVSGAAAVLLSIDPSLTAADVRAALDATALDIDESGVDDASGYGLVQMKAAMKHLEKQLNQ